MEAGKHIIFTVTTDLNYDQRMIRICTTLAEAGYRVTLVGRERPSSIPLNEMPYEQVRLKCHFYKGKLFYLEYNLRLFFYLIRQTPDCFCGIDLDALLPPFLAARRNRTHFTTDQHEYFTEMEEVVNRKLVKTIWKSIEKIVLSRTEKGYTIGNSYKQLFESEYPINMEVIRNAAVLTDDPIPETPEEKYVLYQGAVNHGRGLPQLIRAMHQVNCRLIICGIGDIYEEMQRLVKQEKLQDKVEFKGYVEPADLKKITRQATVGITLFEKSGLSNYYSLANRFFDYLHAGVPQLCMNYPEYAAIQRKKQFGILLDDLTDAAIAKAINQLLDNPDMHKHCRENALELRNELCWQQEAVKLIEFYKQLFRQ